MSTELKDNSKEFLDAMENAIKNGLTAIGMTAEGHAKKEITRQKAVDTGRLRKGRSEMAIKKNHPLYAEYIKKCEALREEHEKQAKRAQGAHCFDGAFNKLFQEQRKELKALQNEYSFLFEED